METKEWERCPSERRNKREAAAARGEERQGGKEKGA